MPGCPTHTRRLRQLPAPGWLIWFAYSGFVLNSFLLNSVALDSVVLDSVDALHGDVGIVNDGDLILALNGKSVTSARVFASTVRGIKTGGVLRLQVQRAQSRLFVALKKP